MHDNTFSIVYDGQPVEDGTIDVRDLAPALLALADLVDESTPLVDPSMSQYSLRVCPNFEKGSFVIHLEFATLYSKIISLFTGNDVQALSNFIQLIGIPGVIGIFHLIKKSKGRKPTKVTIERKETVTITFEGEDPIDVDEKVFKLFSNFRARKSIEQLLWPLIVKGYELFKIKHHGKETVSVTQDEARYFIAPTEHENETISIINTRLVIVSPSFKQGNKWRVSDGGKNIYVSILDGEYLKDVQNGSEAFRKDDILNVSLEIRQWIEEGQLHVDYAILKVHHHEIAPWQQKLFDDVNNSDSE